MLDAISVPRSNGLSSSPNVADLGISNPPANEAPVAPLLNAVRRQFKVAFIVGLLLAIPAIYGAWKWLPPTYSSSAFLRVSAQDAPLMFQTADQGGREDFRTFKNTQRQLLSSPFVLSKAVNLPEVAALPEIQAMDDPIYWLEGSL